MLIKKGFSTPASCRDNVHLRATSRQFMQSSTPARRGQRISGVEQTASPPSAVRYCLCRAPLATYFPGMPDMCEAMTDAYGMDDGFNGAVN